MYSSFKKGEDGEKVVEFWCSMNNFKYLKGTSDENTKKGIDCWINDKATDAKQTEQIYLGNYKPQYNTFLVRHPFRTQTEATHYCFVKVSDKKNIFGVSYFGTISEYLTTEYLKDKNAYETLITILNQYEKTNYKHWKMKSITALLYKIKSSILNSRILKPDVLVHYDEKDFSLVLITKEIEKKFQKNTHSLKNAYSVK